MFICPDKMTDLQDQSSTINLSISRLGKQVNILRWTNFGQKTMDSILVSVLPRLRKVVARWHVVLSNGDCGGYRAAQTEK